MPGRRPTPTAIKELTGNPGKRALNDQEPRPESGMPEMPKGMSRAARREWARITPELLRLGVLSVVDGKALAAYCDAYAIWEEARREIRKYGLVVEEPVFDKDGNLRDNIVKLKANPAVAIYGNMAKQMKTFLIEFGLTPASRSKLRIAKPVETDPMEDMLNRRKQVTELPVTGPGQPSHFDIGAAAEKADVSFDA